MYEISALEPGDIILVAGSSPGEKLLAKMLDYAIEWATVSPFHHAVIVGNGCLIEQLWHVQRSPLNRYESSGWLFKVNTSEAVKGKVVEAATRLLGTQYSIAGILEDGLRDLLHVPYIPRVAPHRYTCSGFIAEVYRRAGCRITNAPLPSPQDLAASPLLIGPRPWRSF